jgi:23S rRNA pseudouridine955/2504/2580 synthase
LILIARRPAILRELHRLLREDQIDKRYLALVAGDWPRARRSVEAPLEKNVLKSGERMVRVSREGKRAVTEFAVLERLTGATLLEAKPVTGRTHQIRVHAQGATLLEAKPVTGRTHQIRVHAQFAGYPLLGDDKYGDARGAALCREIGLKRLFLHASSLRFALPGTGTLELQAPLDQDLDKILEKLRK